MQGGATPKHVRGGLQSAQDEPSAGLKPGIPNETDAPRRPESEGCGGIARQSSRCSSLTTRTGIASSGLSNRILAEDVVNDRDLGEVVENHESHQEEQEDKTHLNDLLFDS